MSAIQNIGTLIRYGKKTDKGGEDCPFHDFGKGGVGVYHAVSLISEETSHDGRLYGRGLVSSAGG